MSRVFLTLIPCLDAMHPYSLFPLLSSRFPIPDSRFPLPSTISLNTHPW
ncbi:MAG: hypothetical protein F6K50_26225 [Moorea sp. SIO3I7]|nr:hypothetical protein [Moorena sp. SIO3I8]NEN98873.1 hypothetical protein [Moorena sp. SIO3I7]NEO07456.1 hypothetical protein [Moorena sp. SIO3I8]